MPRSKQSDRREESPIPRDTGPEGPKSTASAPKTTADRRTPAGKKETLPGTGKRSQTGKRTGSK